MRLTPLVGPLIHWPSENHLIKKNMAQLNGANFLSKWAGLFADNTTGDISAEDMRDFRQDLVDSFPNFLDDAYDAFTVTAGGTNTYTATLSPAITAYSSTHRYFVKFTNANTGAATLNLNSLGAKSIVKNGSLALEVGDITAGQIVQLAYDGTNLQIIGGSNGSAVSGVTYRTRVALTANQIKALHSTPITLIAAPGANKYINYQAAHYKQTYGTTPFNFSTGNWGLRCGSIENATSPSYTVLNDTVNLHYSLPPSRNGVIADLGSRVNQPLTFCFTTGGSADATTGDSVGYWVIYYRIEDLS